MREHPAGQGEALRNHVGFNEEQLLGLVKDGSTGALVEREVSHLPSLHKPLWEDLLCCAQKYQRGFLYPVSWNVYLHELELE